MDHFTDKSLKTYAFTNENLSPQAGNLKGIEHKTPYPVPLLLVFRLTGLTASIDQP